MADPAIRTAFVHPPIPDRRFDWQAMREGDEPGDGPVGHGETENEAVADLLEQIEEAAHG